MKRIAFALALFAAPAFGQVQLPIQPASNGNTACPIVGSGTFANKPASPTTCTRYFATDLGTGVEIVWNGSNWKPATGSAVIAQSAVQQSVTGTLSETNLAVVSVPAGLLSANGSLRIVTLWSVTNNADAKTTVVRFGASGTPTANTAFQQYTSLVSSASGRIFAMITNRNSVSSQVGAQANNFGFAASGGAVATAAVNTANPTFIDLNATLGTNTDTISLESYSVEWIEP